LGHTDTFMHSNADKAQALVDRLQGRLVNVHREGHYVAAACPKCEAGERRFFCGPAVNYRVFHCRQCGHTVTVAELLGLDWQPQSNPAVKPWSQPADGNRIGEIRRIYGALADFAGANLTNPTAITYLSERGFTDGATPDLSQHRRVSTLRRAGLGYIDAQLYRQWYMGLDAGDRVVCEWAGLPDGSKDRFAGHGAMFAAGHAGKIVFAYHNATGSVVDLRTRSISDRDTVGGKRVRYTSPKGTQAARGADVPFGVQLPSAGRIVLTEGEFKALTPALLAGVGVFALRGVDDWQPAYADHLRGKLVILAFDNDHDEGLTPGQMATVRYGRLLSSLGIDVMVLPPSTLGEYKGIDDYVIGAGAAAFCDLLTPKHLLPVSVYEYQLTKDGHDLSTVRTQRSDVGTVRQWTPENAVSKVAKDSEIVSLGEAMSQIRGAVNVHLSTYNRGNAQLLITAPAGVGKTTIALDETLGCLDDGQTVAVLLPNHATIDEKISDGTLAGFQHVYGHNADNCTQHEKVNAWIAKGWPAGEKICPSCPMAQWCAEHGYKSQFAGKRNRAYVHQHAFTSYPIGEDIVIADELTHTPFVATMRVGANDIAAALASDKLNRPQRWLLDGINRLFQAPGLGDLEGAVLYEVLEAVYPPLRQVDEWGAADALQCALDGLAADDIAPESLPQQFGRLLIELLAEDVARRNRGERVTGRVRLVSFGAMRWLELTYRRSLGGWINVNPTVILNATADPDIMREMVGPLRVVAPNVAIAEGNTVLQDVTYNNAKSAYAGASADAERRRAAWLEGIRSHIAQHDGGECDTLLIAAKALTPHLLRTFPNAKIAHYGALEGRNDLQCGLTILASAVPVNLPAIQREAAALWPGIDTALTRSTVAFDYANAERELLAVEQADAVDPRLSGLIGQHRDAAAIQALHRSRVVRKSGRRVVVMFARPIPGITPNRLVTERPPADDKRAMARAALLDRLRSTLMDLVDEMGGAAADLLAAGADCAVNTARKYLPDLCTSLGLNRLVLPVLQPLVTGGIRKREIELVLSPKLVAKIRQQTQMLVNHERYNLSTITNVIYKHLGVFLPNGWAIDAETLIATMLPAHPDPVEEPAPALSGRWRAVLETKRLKAALLVAAGESKRHARTLVDFLNGRHDDRQSAYGAADLLGVRLTIDWRSLRTEVTVS
jgi:hypothetical protein